MKKFVIGALVMGLLVWVASAIGSAEAVGWGFGLVVGVVLAVWLFQALKFTATATAVSVLSDVVESKTRQVKPKAQPHKSYDQRELDEINLKRASYGLPVLTMEELKTRD